MISKLIINIKKLILVLLSASFISFILPSNLLNNTVFAEMDHYRVSSFEDMKKAIKEDHNDEAILLSKDIIIPNKDDYLVIDKNITITSPPNQNYKIVANPKSKFLDIRNNGKVTLDNVTVNLFWNDDVDQYSNKHIKMHYGSKLSIVKEASIHIMSIANTNSKAVYKFPSPCCDHPELKGDSSPGDCPVEFDSNGNLTAPRLKDMKDDCTGACIKNKEKNDKTLTEGMDYTHGQDLIPITSPPNKKLNPKSKFLDTYNNCAINLKNIPVNLSGDDDVNLYNNEHLKMHYGSQLWIDKGDIINTECWDYPELKGGGSPGDCPVEFDSNGNLTTPRLEDMKDNCTVAYIEYKEENDKILTEGTDYTVDYENKTITLKASYISKLQKDKEHIFFICMLLPGKNDSFDYIEQHITIPNHKQTAPPTCNKLTGFDKTEYTYGQDLIPITSPPNKKLNPKSKFLDTYNNCAINLKNIPVNLSGNDDVILYNNKHIKMHYGSQLWIDKGDIINTECWDYPELKVDCPVGFNFNDNLTAPRLKDMKDDCTVACIKNKEKNDKTLTESLNDGSGSDQLIYESNNTKVSTIDNDGIDIDESDDIQLNIPSDSKDNKLTFINPLDLIKNNKLKTTDPTNNLPQDMNYDSNNSDDSTNPDIDEPIIYDDPDEVFEAEDSNTGIQVYAPKGVFPKLSGIIVREMYPNTDEYDNMYKNLDENIKRKIEHIRLYEVCVVNQNGEVIQPNISKGLVTVRIPIPNDYDLADLQIYRIKHDANDNFETNIININNKNYCKFQTNHFSTYTMIDEKTTNDIILSILPYLILLSILTLMSLFIFILKKE